MMKLEEFLKFDMSAGGEAFRVWPKLLGMAFPDLAAKPLMIQLRIVVDFAISNMESSAAQCLDMVEYAAGCGNLSRAFLRRKCRVASLDRKYTDKHDVLTSEGLRLWLMCLVCCARDAFLWFAPECSSWVSLCLSQSCRYDFNKFMGDTTKSFVATGNSFMIITSMLMALALSLGHKIVVEQPMSSTMFNTDWMSHVIRFFQVGRTVTYLGAFGGRTCKPLVLMSSLNLDSMVREKPVMEESLAARGDGNAYTGNKAMLQESEMYTVAFSESMATLVKGHR